MDLVSDRMINIRKRRSLISSPVNLSTLVEEHREEDGAGEPRLLLASFHGARIQPRLENINKHAEK